MLKEKKLNIGRSKVGRAGRRFAVRLNQVG